MARWVSGALDTEPTMPGSAEEHKRGSEQQGRLLEASQ